MSSDSQSVDKLLQSNPKSIVTQLTNSTHQNHHPSLLLARQMFQLHKIFASSTKWYETRIWKFCAIAKKFTSKFPSTLRWYSSELTWLDVHHRLLWFSLMIIIISCMHQDCAGKKFRNYAFKEYLIKRNWIITWVSQLEAVFQGWRFKWTNLLVPGSLNHHLPLPASLSTRVDLINYTTGHDYTAQLFQ